MGFDVAGMFLMLFLFTGFGLGIFFISKYFLGKVFSRFSEKRIFLLSILSVWVIVPLIYMVVIWTVFQFNSQGSSVSSDEYYEYLDEGYLDKLKEGMTKREVIDLIGENDTTKNTIVYDLSLSSSEGKYKLTIEFEGGKVVDFSRNTENADDDNSEMHWRQ